MDGILLEKGIIRCEDFPYFPYGYYTERSPRERNMYQEWVVVHNEQPYVVSAFSLYSVPERLPSVFVHLRRIVEGKVLPWSVDTSQNELLVLLSSSAAQKLKLANCSVGTFKWLKSHPATERVIEKMINVA